MGASAVLIYDGDCAFCQKALDTGVKYLPIFPETVPYQWADLGAAKLTTEQTEKSIYLLVPGRPTRRGARAVASILLAQRGFGWRLLGGLMATPPVTWIAAGVYRLVALNRHRLPGGTAACRVPPRAPVGQTH